MPNAVKKTPIPEALQRIQEGTSHDPFEVLGLHPVADGGKEVTTFLPAAETVELEGVGPMQRVEGTDCFRLRIKPGQAIDTHYSLK